MRRPAATTIAYGPLFPQDAGDIMAHIAKDSAGAAIAFERALRAIVESIRFAPHAGVACTVGKAGTRWRRVIGRARYLVFYRALGSRVVLDRVQHTSRDLAGLLEDPGDPRREVEP
jgi:plasmid stabilization system protein ParE